MTRPAADTMGRMGRMPPSDTRLPHLEVQAPVRLLQAALNGDRDHPAAPRTPSELGAESRAAVNAGAVSLHLHPYDQDRRQTLEAEVCAAALRAVRVKCPGIPISLSTSAGIEPDPDRRYAHIAAWTELPDLVTVNQGEDGIMKLCDLLVARGIGIEAGLLSLGDAQAFVASGIASRCVRTMVEPLDPVPEDAVAHAEVIEQALSDGRGGLEQVHHGDGVASWAVNQRAAGRGHGIRTGLEDTPLLPDGRAASCDAELVAAAASLLNSSQRSSHRRDGFEQLAQPSARSDGKSACMAGARGTSTPADEGHPVSSVPGLAPRDPRAARLDGHALAPIGERWAGSMIPSARAGDREGRPVDSRHLTIIRELGRALPARSPVTDRPPRHLRPTRLS